jgi:hypothetical protein
VLVLLLLGLEDLGSLLKLQYFNPVVVIGCRKLQVNPIAVNSKYCNVFTENKRCICIIQTKDFGKVQYLEIEFIMFSSYFSVIVIEYAPQPVVDNSGGCPDFQLCVLKPSYADCIGHEYRWHSWLLGRQWWAP